MIRDHTTTWFGRCLGWPLDTFFWALTILWSRLWARVWSGPKVRLRSPHSTKCIRLRTLPFKLNYDTPSPMKSIISPILVHFQGPRSGHFHLSSWILQSGTWDMLGIWHYVLRYGGHKRKNKVRVDQNKSSKMWRLLLDNVKRNFSFHFVMNREWYYTQMEALHRLWYVVWLPIWSYTMLQLYTRDLIFYQQLRWNWFVVYRTLTSLLGQNSHQPVKVIALRNSA